MIDEIRSYHPFMPHIYTIQYIYMSTASNNLMNMQISTNLGPLFIYTGLHLLDVSRIVVFEITFMVVIFIIYLFITNGKFYDRKYDRKLNHAQHCIEFFLKRSKMFLGRVK